MALSELTLGKRRFVLTKWDEKRRATITIHTMYEPCEKDVPWTIEFNGKTYQQGQCSGPAMSVVWYDEV